jgi:hypothetical protein
MFKAHDVDLSDMQCPLQERTSLWGEETPDSGWPAESTA